MADAMDALMSKPMETAMVAARKLPSARSALGEFESYLISQMLREGAKPVTEEHPLDGGRAGRMYRELFFEEIGKLAARQSGFGLTDSLQGALSREDSQ